MLKKSIIAALCAAFLLGITACDKPENIIDSPEQENVPPEDNLSVIDQINNGFFIEDLNYLRTELPHCHQDLYALISEESFNNALDHMISQVSQLSDVQLVIALQSFITSLGDPNTCMYTSAENYNVFPLQFWIFDGEVYIVNAGPEYEDMLYTKVLKIGGVDIDTVIEALTALIPHANESALLARLPSYLETSYYLYGLDLIDSKDQAVFTVQTEDAPQEFTVPASLDHSSIYNPSAEFIRKERTDVVIGEYLYRYNYDYLSEQNALYFAFNRCAGEESFLRDNTEMFNVIEEHQVKKIIIDLRSHSGENSEIFSAFTERLKTYVEAHSDVKVFILAGRNTNAAGILAIYRIKEVAPEAVSVGEPTSGAIDAFGDRGSFQLPNSQIRIIYTVNEVDRSGSFSYHNDGVDTFLPDVTMQPTFEDYINENDVVLNYALAH